jgi:integrase
VGNFDERQWGISVSAVTAGGPAQTGPGPTPQATELANSDVNVYTLMKLLGHESMTTSQRYVTAAGTETRSAAAQNPPHRLIPDSTKS